jgi:hypothetical protein
VPSATPAGQRGTHTQVPLRRPQTFPEAQRRPRPQEGPPGQRLATSTPQVTPLRSTVHAVSHGQRPLMRASPAAPMFPHPPQLPFSTCVSTQRALQSASLAGQRQRESTQSVPGGQPKVHRPPLSLSRVV